MQLDSNLITLAQKIGLDKNKVLLEYMKTFLWSFSYIKKKRLFKNHKKEYMKLNNRKEFNINEMKNFPCVDDWQSAAGVLTTYFYQDLWAARKIFSTGTKKHFDIGSRVDGFVLSLLPFANVTLIDIRPLNINVEGLYFLQADATNLENIEDNSIDSLSALCSLEHFGLGRYGDPIDPEACFKAFKAIQRVIKMNGKIYISVPIATKDGIEFNAHRIFSPQTIINEFNKVKLLEFNVVKNDGRFYENALVNKDWEKNPLHSDFGLFEFIKI